MPRSGAETKGPEMHDLSRSDITIQDASAPAAVCSDRERLGLDRSAFRTGLGSSTRIDFDQFATGTFSLVAKVGDDLSPRGVVNVLGKHPSRQAFDVEIFDCDAPKAVDEIAADLVAEVAPLRGDVTLKLGECPNALATDFGPALAPSNGSLSPAQPLGRALGPVRAVYRFPVAQRDKTSEAKINAHTVGTGAIFGRNVNVKNNIPLVALPRQDGGLRLGRQVSMPADLDLARDADDAELAGLAKRQAVTHAKVSGMVAANGAEARKSGFGSSLHASEEGTVCLVETAKNLLFGSARPAANFRHVPTQLRKMRRLRLVSQGNPTTPRADTLFKGRIVKAAEVGQHVGKSRSLRAIRIDAVFVGEYQDAGLRSVRADQGQERAEGLQSPARSSFITPKQQMKGRAFRSGLNAGVPSARTRWGVTR